MEYRRIGELIDHASESETSSRDSVSTDRIIRIIARTKSRLYGLEIYPFRFIIQSPLQRSKTGFCICHSPLVILSRHLFKKLLKYTFIFTH